MARRVIGKLSSIRLRLSAMLGFSLETLSNASRTIVFLMFIRVPGVYDVREPLGMLAHFALNTSSFSMTYRMLTCASMASASWLDLNSVVTILWSPGLISVVMLLCSPVLISVPRGDALVLLWLDLSLDALVLP